MIPEGDYLNECQDCSLYEYGAICALTCSCHEVHTTIDINKCPYGTVSWCGDDLKCEKHMYKM